MREIIHGKIISTNLGEFSKKKVVYGYLGIELPDKEHIKVKVDAYTQYETLNLGDKVVVEIESLGDTDILVARKIQLTINLNGSAEENTATA
ncbi:MAG: hypothetical protein ACFFCX_09285 [Candidatus Sifarchaeia archaeon]